MLETHAPDTQGGRPSGACAPRPPLAPPSVPRPSLRPSLRPATPASEGRPSSGPCPVPAFYCHKVNLRKPVSSRKKPVPNKFMPQVLRRANNFTASNIRIKMKKKKALKNALLSQRRRTRAAVQGEGSGGHVTRRSSERGWGRGPGARDPGRTRGRARKGFTFLLFPDFLEISNFAFELDNQGISFFFFFKAFHS